ncbi:MAG: hypothetical protein WEF86_15905, partial [Gemmatimonadota bacterium]
ELTGTSWSGVLVQESGTLENAAGGTVRGAGELDLRGGTFANHGVLEPGRSAGTLTVSGNVAQILPGELNVEIGGLTAGTEYDRVQISGDAQIAGTLNIAVIEGFVPEAGDTFLIVNSLTRAGTFGAVTGTDLGGGLVMQVTYTATGVVLTVAAASGE